MDLEIAYGNLEEMSDRELMQWYYLAQELRCGKYIKAVQKELNRRGAE